MDWIGLDSNAAWLRCLGCVQSQSHVQATDSIGRSQEGSAVQCRACSSADICMQCRVSHDGGLLLLLLYAAENLMHSGGYIFNRAHLGVILYLPSKRENDHYTTGN